MEVRDWSDYHRSCTRIDTSFLTHFVREKTVIWLNLPEEQADLKD